MSDIKIKLTHLEATSLNDIFVISPYEIGRLLSQDENDYESTEPFMDIWAEMTESYHQNIINLTIDNKCIKLWELFDDNDDLPMDTADIYLDIPYHEVELLIKLFSYPFVRDDFLSTMATQEQPNGMNEWFDQFP